MSDFSNAMTGVQSPLKKLELALQKEVVGGSSKKDADFKEAYELIEQNLKSGDIAKRLNVAQNTLSTQLMMLSHARLVKYTRDGRSIRISHSGNRRCTRPLCERRKRQ